MIEIKSIDKNSLAKIFALIYGFIGFFIALIVAISTMANIVMQKDFSGSVILVTLFNIGAGLLLGILAALFTALIGWVIGFISAGMYNWFAAKVGGIKAELAEVGVKAVKQDKAEDLNSNI
ncbi:MAG: hypothetical protein Q8O93_04780 [bacterium]|nr:hypothetical protein [bacterium]